jgi:hypothetical protein
MLIKTFKICLILVIATGLGRPASVNLAEKPLGMVTQCSKAVVDNEEPYPGTTVYAGDTLETDTDGYIRLRIGLTQLYLMGGSISRLLESSGGARATMSRGTTGFSSDPSGSVELTVLGATVWTRPGHATHGRVTISGPSEFIVSSRRGSFGISIDDDSHIIEEGQSFRVQIVDADDQTKNGSGTIPARRSHRKALRLVLCAGIVVGTGVGAYYIYREEVESPTRP